MSTSTEPAKRYHHGDLRSALLVSAMAMLEEGEPFSLRGLARRSGVSATAPYRHFADREAIESALAEQGLRDLMADLLASGPLPTRPGDLAEFGVTYVNFALRRPALFRLMFGQECSEENDARVPAAAELGDALTDVMRTVFPGGDADTLAAACWALAHGLAFLHLDGKFASASRAEADARVRSAFHALLAVRPA